MDVFDRTESPLTATLDDVPEDSREILLKYYEVAGPDYSYWSRNMNMHFGFWRRGLAPWNREGMLEQMSQEVFDRFQRSDDDHFHALDAGCGVGASIKTALRRFSRGRFDGITVVPWQIEQARQALKDSSRSCFLLKDFQNSRLPEGSYDFCYSIEAAVHADGLNKQAYANEMFRVLKSGGKLIVVDCFLQQPPDSFDRITRKVYQAACNGWAVKEMAHLPSFMGSLRSAGFENIKFTDTSWRVAPSVVHVPFVSLKYVLQAIIKRRKVAKESWRHVVACLSACYLGVQLDKFRYGIIEAEKPRS